MIYIGIDPGLHGAVAVINDEGKPLGIWDTPVFVIKSGKRKYREYDLFEMSGLLESIMLQLDQNNLRCQAIIEQAQAMPQQGVTSTFRIGYGYGAWKALLAAHAIASASVRPAEWKKLYGLTRKEKDASIMRAKELFPQIEDWKKVRHDGAEALLLAEYGRRTIKLA